MRWEDGRGPGLIYSGRTCTAARMWISIHPLHHFLESGVNTWQLCTSIIFYEWLSKENRRKYEAVNIHADPRLAPSSLVILTDFCEDKDSSETKWNVKRGRKCPTIQQKTSLCPLRRDDGVLQSCHLLESVITNLLIINYSKVDIFIANGP